MAAETCCFANSPPSSGDDSAEVRVRRRKSSVPRHLPGTTPPAKRPRRPFRPWGTTTTTAAELPPSPPPTSGESRLSSPPPRCELTPPSEPTPPPQLVLRLQTPPPYVAGAAPPTTIKLSPASTPPPPMSCLTVPPPRFVPPSPTGRRRPPPPTCTVTSSSAQLLQQQQEPLSLVHKPSTAPPTLQQQQHQAPPPTQQRNYKNMTRERRIEANARERTRVHTISAAFDTLRRAVPSYAHAQKLSKLSVLRIASAYILTLSRIAGKDYSEDSSSPSLADCVAGVSRTIQTEGKLRRKKDCE